MDNNLSDKQTAKVFRPNIDTIGKNDTLTYESSAYKTFYQLNTEWPSMSFEILSQNLQSIHRAAPKKTRYPLSLTIVSGTQTTDASKNTLDLYKINRISKTKHDEDSDEENNSEQCVEPEVKCASLNHPGSVNRLKSMPQDQNIVATWAGDSKVYIWKLHALFNNLESPDRNKKKLPMSFNPCAKGASHSTEGFALAWSPLGEGSLTSGDCHGKIFLSKLRESGLFADKLPFKGHSSSVEDLQWSPVDESVFASCSVDRSIAMWDTRLPNRCPASVVKKAHNKDVNVLSWNPLSHKLLASGADDGSFKVWDLRFFSAENPVSFFKWNKKAITSIEWSSFDLSVLVTSSEDDTISIWDLSVEEDFERKTRGAALTQNLPAQLMFVHQGQKEIKEVHFSGEVESFIASTSLEGFNFFIPDNI